MEPQRGCRNPQGGGMGVQGESWCPSSVTYRCHQLRKRCPRAGGVTQQRPAGSPELQQGLSQGLSQQQPVREPGPPHTEDKPQGPSREARAVPPCPRPPAPPGRRTAAPLRHVALAAGAGPGPGRRRREFRASAAGLLRPAGRGTSAARHACTGAKHRIPAKESRRGTGPPGLNSCQDSNSCNTMWGLPQQPPLTTDITEMCHHNLNKRQNQHHPPASECPEGNSLDLM
ncbi:vasodilator-stimulated phosphoprotein-like [Tyto alba]|uniref:vasodilator-stimulated phosphoprotein-like n=1 Tax=Tyto alba TaxID=56313 RepID=UPI001C66E4AD|nr:vasodilator-stimulated phosphoprotein-like [Tyto alba]